MNIARGYPALKSFFFSELSRGLNSEDEFIILVMALIRVQTHNGGTTAPFGTYIPASGKRRKEKIEITDIITEWTYNLRGSAVANVKTGKVYRQRLCTGELWEFVMNSVAVLNQFMPLLSWRLIYHASHVCSFFLLLYPSRGWKFCYIFLLIIQTFTVVL